MTPGISCDDRVAPPCVIFEDDHLLVVIKPAGMNTHSPSPLAGEGIYDWLRNREPRWANLAIIHRLDKETSGVVVFGKSTAANRSLTAQFTERSVSKSYVLLTDRTPRKAEFEVRSNIVRRGERYASGAHGEPAVTLFRANLKSEISNLKSLQAEPLTGRTHQIRVHAAESGIPIVGDTLYGGVSFPRLCLHAAGIRLRHPQTGRPLEFTAPVDFNADNSSALRQAIIDPDETDAFRMIHGASDGWPGWYVDRFSDRLLSAADRESTGSQRNRLERWISESGGSAPPVAYHKLLEKSSPGASISGAPRFLELPGSKPGTDPFQVRENGVRFELSFAEGYSVGLFLDQRDNRRRLLTRHIAAGFDLWDLAQGKSSEPPQVLNAFAYTCAFSVCAAVAGARTVSVDLSGKYLAWGRRNFELNGLDPGAHEFIRGDVFEWFRRLVKSGRRFDVVMLDPPTFSRSKARGVFKAEKDYPSLVRAALPLIKPGGVLFASSNTTGWPAEKFLTSVEDGIEKRRIVCRHYSPQPLDFPISRLEPAYLKTAWLRLD